MITFHWIYAWLLLPLPWLIHFFWPKPKEASNALYIPHLSEHSGEHDNLINRKNRVKKIPLALLTLFWFLFLFALANPVKLGDPIELPTSGRDLLLAVDISPSMEERDMFSATGRIDRLTATKQVISRFLEKRQGDRVGLILYGATAHMQAPLTFDLRSVETFLQEAQTRFAGNATAIGDAVGLGIEKLLENPVEHRTLILLSDGENTTGKVNPLDAARFARQENIKIYTVALGHPRSRSPVDERLLKHIATETAGLFFRARNPEELENIYEEIDRLEPILQAAEIFRPEKPLFNWPLGGMMLTLCLLGIYHRFSHLIPRPV